MQTFKNKLAQWSSPKGAIDLLVPLEFRPKTRFGWYAISRCKSCWHCRTLDGLSWTVVAPGLDRLLQAQVPFGGVERASTTEAQISLYSLPMNAAQMGRMCLKCTPDGSEKVQFTSWTWFKALGVDKCTDEEGRDSKRFYITSRQNPAIFYKK